MQTTTMAVTPKRRILEVILDPKGGLTKLALDCGHTVRVNQSFTYKVGNRTRCFRCDHPELADWQAEVV